MGTHVSDSAAIDTEEGKDKTKQTGENGEAGVHVELKLSDDAGNSKEDDGADEPDPHGDLILWGSKVLDKTIILIGLGGLLLDKGNTLTLGLQGVVDSAAQGSDGELGTIVDDSEVNEEFNQAVDDEDHDTGPEEPVSGRWDVVGVGGTRQTVEGHEAFPLGSGLATLNSDALSVVNKERTSECPGKDGTSPPGDGGVQANQDTGAEEGRGQLDVPTPVVRLKQSVVAVAAPDEEPDKDVPVVQDAIGVLAHDDEEEGSDEGVAKSLDLLQGIGGTGSDGVHRTDGHGGGSGGGEDEVQLSGDVDDEELSKRDSGEETEEGADKGDGENTAEIALGVVREKFQPVHGGETGHEDTGHATGAGSSSLDDGVFLGSELLADIRDAGQELGQHENEAIAEDGSEHGRGKGEASLETCWLLELDVTRGRDTDPSTRWRR